MLLLLLTLFWLTFTHLQGRFFILAIPIAALLIVQLPPGLPLRIAAVAIAIQLIISTIFMAQKFTQQATLIRDAGALALDDFKAFLPESFVEALNGQEN